ncbi:MAG TPA: hypothetical protein VF316_11115 [Polyangiaceae bacterium]
MRILLSIGLSLALVACGSSSSDPEDAAPEAAVDATSDGPLDATPGTDASLDATLDASSDASLDASSDAALDASKDASKDAASEASSSDAGSGCTGSGGTVGTSLCCKNTTDFPNTCNVGPCGCSPQNSHTVQVCQCPQTKCFDGTKCK